MPGFGRQIWRYFDDHWPGAAGKHGFEGPLDDLGNLAQRLGTSKKPRERREERLLVKPVEHLRAVAPGHAPLVAAHDQHQGNAVGEGIEHPGGSIGRPGAGHCQGRRHLAAGPREPVGHHRRALFVARQVMGQRGFEPMKCVVEGYILRAGHAKHGPRAARLQRAQQQIGGSRRARGRHGQNSIPSQLALPKKRKSNSLCPIPGQSRAAWCLTGAALVSSSGKRGQRVMPHL